MDETEERTLKAAADRVDKTRSAWKAAVVERRELIKRLRAQGARPVDLVRIGRVDRSYINQIMSGRGSAADPTEGE